WTAARRLAGYRSTCPACARADLASPGADGGEELLDLALQPAAFVGQRARRAVDLTGGRAGVGCAAIDLADIAGDLRRAHRRLLHVAGDLLRRSALLLDGRGDHRGDIGDALDDGADLPDRADRHLRRRLHLRDLAADLLRRLRGLARERLDLRGDDRKAAAGF